MAVPLLSLVLVLTGVAASFGGEVAVDTGAVSCFGAAGDSAGTVWVAVGRPDAKLQVFRSDDQGMTWTSPAWFQLDSFARQVEVVVGRGDSGRVFVFYLSAANDGDLWVVALDPVSMEWRRSAVCVGPDTIDDFSVAVDLDTNYYLYCLYANERRAGLTGHFTRSRDFGRTWDATQDWWNCWDPCVAHMSGSTVHVAWRDAETGRRIYYSWNRHYGAPAHWGPLHPVGSGTGRSFDPVVAVSDTAPEWLATVWVFYSVGRRDSSMTDIEFSYSTDGGWSWQTGLPLDSTFADEWLPDAQAGRNGSAVDLCYYYGGKGPNEPTAVMWRCGSSWDPGYFSAAVKVSNMRCEPATAGCRPRVVQFPGTVPHSPGFLFSRAGPSGVWFAAPLGGPGPVVGTGVVAVPNPCRAGMAVMIRGLDDSRMQRVEVFDAAGRQLRVVRGGLWDGRDELGRAVPAGAYLLRCGAARGRVVLY
ncbi:MAG: sialidase family protein [candidate division WOR-3 bacterium]